MATQTSQQTIRLAPFQEDFLADIFQSAKDITEPGSSMPFSAQQLAALSPAQQQAISSAMGGVGSFQPFCKEVVKLLVKVLEPWARDLELLALH